MRKGKRAPVYEASSKHVELMREDGPSYPA
jgi:hypothetical protein